MSKATSKRDERILSELRTQDAYKECADCGTSRPGWASWNLGITLCVACAQIHRSLGTDVSKVKSMTLDVWTKEQVDSMKAMGNIKSNAKYNSDLRAHPPPTDLEGSERNSQMQRYIVKKYRDRAFMAPKKVKQSVEDSIPSSSRSVRFSKPSPPSPTVSRSPSPERKLPDLSSSATRKAPVSILRSNTAPLPEVSRTQSLAVLAPNNPFFNRGMTASAQIPSSSSYTPAPASSAPGTSAFLRPPLMSTLSTPGLATSQPAYIPSQSVSSSYQPAMSAPPAQPKGGIWDDLAGLSLASSSSSLPIPSVSAPSSRTWTPQPAALTSSFAAELSRSNPFLRTSPGVPTYSPSISPSPANPYAFAYQPQQAVQPSLMPQSSLSHHQNGLNSTNPFCNQSNQPSFNTFAQNPYASQMAQHQQQYQYAAPQPMYQYQQNFG